MSLDTVKIAVLGCGTVGSQVVRLLAERGGDYAARCGAHVEVSGIAVRDIDAPRPDWIDRDKLTVDADALIDDADIVIELIGGIEPARTWVLRALRAGATVVTGNKALLASHGPELHDAARESGASLYFEAAVAGAVPVVYGLRESLAGDRVEGVLGIVNGTTNYILDQMATHGWSYDEALARAQELGYAEADPTADVDGLDAAAKCAILASLAFHTRVGIDDVAVEGVRSITPADIAAAKRAGGVIKLLAHARRVRTDEGEAVSVHVAPTLVSTANPLASVSGAFNAVVIDAEAAGRLMFYGQGAGGVQTASAVLSDVVAAATHIAHGGSAPRESAYESLPILPASQVTGEFQLRFAVPDRTGVLAEIAGIFAAHGISIAALEQTCEDDTESTLTLTTHHSTRSAIDAALDELTHTDSVTRVIAVMMREA
ncbi:homoserine dehydrogenase [Nanchangia anserum]|uniref:Homoserine dehydrogenase n=1 Tax=Nanchangia anserum TaxID=2692125 RepID=A0A8I0GDA5_9ACTO|nr:homoserine dehydrogenase [Nanchangia anserum]MBD3690040.1 homoserine dehydrogenase [Nanchangia anserum]QOX82164.1 homoserine dehydrogenase [Nanchangia anserum]